MIGQYLPHTNKKYYNIFRIFLQLNTALFYLIFDDWRDAVRRVEVRAEMVRGIHPVTSRRNLYCNGMTNGALGSRGALLRPPCLDVSITSFD